MAQSASDEECGICLDSLANPVALPCSHRFCSKCLDSWRSKYGARGDKEKIGRACPLCREKIPPSKEMVVQLQCFRRRVEKMEAAGDTSSSNYTDYKSQLQRLEREVGDWTEADVLDYGEDEYLELPASIVKAAKDDDVQKILHWLGPPPVDKKRLNARNGDWMNSTLIFAAVISNNSILLSILLQFGADVNAVNAMGVSALAVGIKAKNEGDEQVKLLLEWGAATDPQYFRLTTMEEVASFVLKGNAKLANLLKSELGGRRCELVNYSTRPELNGKTCVVEKYLPDKDRYKITFEGSGEKALVPPHNLKRRDRTPADCGYYITHDKGMYYSRCDFASKEECQAYVAEVELKHATDQLAGLNIGSSGSPKGRRGKKGKKMAKKKRK